MSESWIYQGKEFTDDDIGDAKAFVYIITNMTNDRYYIGRKNFHAPKYSTVKGKRKKKMVISDYKEYWGSNIALQEEIKTVGKEWYTREILHLCKSKGESNYIEAKIQFERQVLLDELSYNRIINCRIHASHVKNLEFIKPEQ